MGGKKGLNLSGQWSGEYAYPAQAGPVTPFLATIVDEGGHLSGTIIEPEIFGTLTTAEARLVGLRQGTSVDFTKTYVPPAPPGYENPIDYVGRLSADGNVVKGVWSLLSMDGTFEMRREEAAAELEEAKEEIALPVPASDPA